MFAVVVGKIFLTHQVCLLVLRRVSNRAWPQKGQGYTNAIFQTVEVYWVIYFVTWVQSVLITINEFQNSYKMGCKEKPTETFSCLLNFLCINLFTNELFR